jgi:putative selenium metabolism hydrolase
MEEKIKKINELSKKYEKYTAENLSKIVKIKSLSLNEKEVAEELVRQMKEAKFDEVRIDGLGNVIGRVGSGKKILAIDGHIDTVDIGVRSNWNFEPLSGEIKDGFVHGRGTVDQKGGVSSFVTAGRILKELGLDKELTVYFVGSVIEEDCDGLCWNWIIEKEKIKPDFCISTEPTSCRLLRGHRGRMEINVIFRGISAHGSNPDIGKNAIYMASKFCLEVEKLNTRLKSDPFLGKGSVTVSEMITGAPSLCAVSDYAKVHLDRRLTQGETKESAVKEVEDLLKEMKLEGEVKVLHYEATSFTGTKYGMEKYYPTWTVEENSTAVTVGVKAHKELYGKEPTIGKWIFSTNGVTIRGVHGVPCIGFGPGDEVMAHAPNEKIRVNDLVICSAFYAAYALYLAEEK